MITQPDRPGKRGKRPVPSAVKTLTTQHNLTVLQPERLRSSDLPSAGADLLVVVAYGQILRQPVLDWPRLGCVNVHASLLPRWRGAAPIQRALLAGDSETGACIMQMDAGLDTGAVLARTTLPIGVEDTTTSLEGKLAAAGAPLLIETMQALADGTARPTAQPDEGVTYAHKINANEAWIDWSQPAAHISRQVRAFEPAVTRLGDLRVRLWQASAEPVDTQALPGTIVEATKMGIVVATGEDALRIHALQLPIGKGRVITASDALNSRADLFAPGELFTSHQLSTGQ